MTCTREIIKSNIRVERSVVERDRCTFKYSHDRPPALEVVEDTAVAFLGICAIPLQKMEHPQLMDNTRVEVTEDCQLTSADRRGVLLQ